MKPLKLIYIPYILISLTLTSCSTTKLTVDLTSNVLKEGIVTFFEESDMELARRGMESNIKFLEVFHRANPENKNMRILLAQVYGGYSFIFLETDALYPKNKEDIKRNTERISEFYFRGLNYGLSILKEKPRFKRAIEKNNLPLLTKAAGNIKDPEILFWTIFNWTLLINLNKSSVEHISDLPKLNILVDRMLELDRSFFHGAPLAIKAVIECAMPKTLGGKPEKGIKLLEEALEIGKRNFLITQLMYAQYCTPAVQDKKMFYKLVNEINKFDPNTNPDVVLINKAVKEKIPMVKHKVKELFL